MVVMSLRHFRGEGAKGWWKLGEVGAGFVCALFGSRRSTTLFYRKGFLCKYKYQSRAICRNAFKCCFRLSQVLNFPLCLSNAVLCIGKRHVNIANPITAVTVYSHDYHSLPQS